MAKTVTTINAQPIISESVTSSGVTTEIFVLRAETFLLSVDITAISGTLDIKAEILDEDTGSYKEVVTFPQFSAIPSEIQILQSPYSLDKVRITATYSAACTYKIHAKGVSGGTTTITSSDGNSVDINDDGQMHVVLRGSVCDTCSSTTPLSAGFDIVLVEN